MGTEKDAEVDKEKSESIEKVEEKTETANEEAKEKKDVLQTEESVEKDKEQNEDQKTTPTEIEEDFILPLENLVKHVTWTNNDAEYYLKEVNTKKILSEKVKNDAMSQMLQAFVDLKPISQPSPAAARMGPKSAQQQKTTPQNRNQKGGPQKRGADGDCDVVMERITKVSKPASPRVKTEDEILL